MLKFAPSSHVEIKRKPLGKFYFQSKTKKVPRGIRGEKSSKDMANSRNLVSTIKFICKTLFKSSSL